jgi:hypothetical protein
MLAGASTAGDMASITSRGPREGPPQQWSRDDVAAWLTHEVGVDVAVAAKLWAANIRGVTLPRLSEGHLIDRLGIDVGPALDIIASVAALLGKDGVSAKLLR